MIKVYHPAQFARIALAIGARAGRGIAAHPAVFAHRGRCLQVPFTYKAPAERFVGKHTGGAYFHQVAAEAAFQAAVPSAPEVHLMVTTQSLQVLAAGIVLVIAHTAITGDAAVHFMIDERTQILIEESPFFPPVTAYGVPGHQGHVLQVAFTALFTDRAIVRMVDHHLFDDACTEGLGALVVEAVNAAVLYRGHAADCKPALGIIGVAVFDHCALATGTDRAHRRVPTEVGQIHFQTEAGMQQVLPRIYLIVSVIYCYFYFCHKTSMSYFGDPRRLLFFLPYRRLYRHHECRLVKQCGRLRLHHAGNNSAW